MPIKGLTDRGLAFPEIGQIRKGAPKDDSGRLGKDLSYFRVEFDEAEQEAEKIFLQKYGKEPKEINILLAFNEIERVWDAWYEAYTAGRMVARSDGERFLYKINTSNNEAVVKDGIPHVPFRDGMPVGTYTDNKGKEQNIYCKPVGRLRVVIPELQRFAYLTLITSSKHDIANLSAQLEALKQVNGESIAGVPLVLRRRPKKISCPKADGTRARYTKYMLSIEADPHWVKAKLTEVQRLALPGSGTLLPDGEEDIVLESENELSGYMDDDLETVDVPSDPVEDDTETESEEDTRPYSPEYLKKRVSEFAEKHSGKKANDKQRGLLVGTMELCFAHDGADRDRHELCQFLTGDAVSKKIPDNYVLALLDWLAPAQDKSGAYAPGDMAVKEAVKALAFSRKQNGQGELF